MPHAVPITKQTTKSLICSKKLINKTKFSPFFLNINHALLTEKEMQYTDNKDISKHFPLSRTIKLISFFFFLSVITQVQLKLKKNIYIAMLTKKTVSKLYTRTSLT